MNTTLLVRFVAVADELHYPRAANTLNIPLASLYSSIEKLEAEVGHPLFTREQGRTRLTAAGVALLPEAKAEIAAAPPAAKPVVPPGGKAKASKGKGRTPAVKGQPKPFKKRQGR